MPLRPRISIVTPSFQQAGTIEATIRSVLDQDYPDFEHIVMDGGSTDGTVDVLDRYPHLVWDSGPDAGQTDAINKGLARATGEIVAYLNSDDVYRPGAFARAAEEFSDPSCVVLVADCDVIDEAGRTIGLYRAALGRPEELVEYWRWDDGVCIPQPAVFLRRSAVDQAGAFDASYDLAMDLEMWLRLGRRFPFRVIAQSLAGYRETPDTKTSTRRPEMLLESCRAALEHIAIVPVERRAAAARKVRRTTAELLLADASKRADLWPAVRLWPGILRAPKARRLLMGLS